MRPLTQDFGRTIRGSTIVLLGLLFAGTTLQAQIWEWVYGEKKSKDDGIKRVTVVDRGCEGGGYIAVGSNIRSDGVDVYIVRTDNNGAKIWENTYDITGNGDEDFGRSIYELAEGKGFIVTGHTYYSESGRTDVFLLNVDCNGKVQWSMTYGGEESDEYGFDVIETATGKKGEFIVAGWAYDPNQSRRSYDAYMLRTDVNGAYIWDQRYDNGVEEKKDEEYFYALTELTPYDSDYGDVIAVGHAYDTETQETEAYVVRASSVDGTIGNAPQGAALYGVEGARDGFYSVIELQNPEELGEEYRLPNVVIVGELKDQNYIYGVKLSDGYPCRPLAQTATGIDKDIEFGTDVREIPFATDGYDTKLKQYDLIVTGMNAPAATGDPGDAILIAFDETTLLSDYTIINGRYTTGVDAGSIDQGWSLEPVEERDDRTFGVAICGLTLSDPEGVGDPQDMYLLKTDGNGKTGCSYAYKPKSFDIDDWECITPTWVSLKGDKTYETPLKERDWGYNNCPVGKSAPDPGSIARASFDASLMPNPVRTGEIMTFGVTASVDATFDVTITNALGQTVSRNRLANAGGTLSVGTADLPAGVYNVTLARGGHRVTIRVVVVE